MTVRILSKRTPFLSCLLCLKPVISTFATSKNKTTKTHQLAAGNETVVSATTNSNNKAIIMRNIVVKMVFILKMLM